jgi:hypothetical protein
VPPARTERGSSVRQPLALADARRLTQHFARMVGNLEGEKLDGWLEEAETPEAQVMKKFAAGLAWNFREHL